MSASSATPASSERRIRTRDPQSGKVMFYHWNYVRILCRLHDSEHATSDYKSDALPTELLAKSFLNAGEGAFEPHAVKLEPKSGASATPPHPI